MVKPGITPGTFHRHWQNEVPLIQMTTPWPDEWNRLPKRFWIDLVDLNMKWRAQMIVLQTEIQCSLDEYDWLSQEFPTVEALQQAIPDLYERMDAARRYMVELDHHVREVQDEHIVSLTRQHLPWVEHLRLVDPYAFNYIRCVFCHKPAHIMYYKPAEFVTEHSNTWYREPQIMFQNTCHCDRDSVIVGSSIHEMRDIIERSEIMYEVLHALSNYLIDDVLWEIKSFL